MQYYGLLGDYIGGVWGTLLTALTVFGVFLTFWWSRRMDYRAKTYQVFAEMMRTHEEIVASFRIGSKTGRDTFSSVLSEFYVIYKLTRQVVGDDAVWSIADRVDIAYTCTFFGPHIVSEEVLKDYGPERIKQLFGEIHTERQTGKSERHQFGGHQLRLSHYFRNLFSAYTFVDGTRLSMEEKLALGKVLRSKLSNHEQAVLALNIMSHLGAEWERTGLVEKYKPIKNLPSFFLTFDRSFKIKDRFPYVNFEWETTAQRYCQGASLRLPEFVFRASSTPPQTPNKSLKRTAFGGRLAATLDGRSTNMADLKKSEVRAIEKAMAFPRGFGYVLDFSDRTFDEYFKDELGVEIYSEQFSTCGTSKRNRLLSCLQQADNFSALKVLRSLWDLREGLLSEHEGLLGIEDAAKDGEQFRKVIERLQGEPDSVLTDGIQTFAPDRTLEELVADIERSLSANKPEAAIDHLHTYCMKRFSHLLRVRGIECSDDEPLHSRFGKYRKQLMAERHLHEFTDRARKSFISLLESFNDLRNNHSLAHDNTILETFQARFIFSSINAMLVMIRTLEAGRYES